MNKIYRFNLILFTLFFVTTLRAAGQDTIVALTEPWAKLKTQLQRKADITINLTSIIGRSEKADKELIGKIRSTATALRHFIDTSKNHDSLTIRQAYQKNIDLNSAVATSLFVLMDDTKFKAQQEYRDLQMQLEGIENRITFATRNYNDACIKYQRPDLVFGKIKTGNSPQVSF